MEKHPTQYTAADFGVSPLMFYFEVTQACDLVCKHCRAEAQTEARPGELSTRQAQDLLDQVASFPKPPHVVLTGGDPLKRSDLLILIRHARAQGLQVALTPSATPLATRQAFQEVQAAGVQRLGISLDGADAATHDAFRGWNGSFDRTLAMLADARDLGLPVQINTTVTRRNYHQLDDLARLLANQGIAMWAVFFLIPVGRGVFEERLSPQEYELVFEQLWRLAQRQPYPIKTTEAPHYRRFVLQRGGDPLAAPAGAPGAPRLGHRAPLGVGDGKGIMFVSHVGEIYPSGFLPLLCGRFPTDSVVTTYQRHPTFLALRDPNQFHGKCGLCDFRFECGGSRARAYAVTGDPLGAEPDCDYLPAGWDVIA
ncbi:MAG: TIGR04053 family radical SAM/SPASM domain-containing protein [Pirellulales bacterium]